VIPLICNAATGAALQCAMSESPIIHHPFFWLIAGLVLASLFFGARLVIKGLRRAKLEKASHAARQETLETPPEIG
jgi:hypothetical protein